MDSAIALAIFTAAFYIISVVHYNGYLGAIGVDIGFISRSFHDVLYYAFFVTLTPLFSVLTYLILTALILYFISNIFTIALISFKFRRWLVFLRKKSINLKHSDLENHAFALLVKTTFIAVFFYLFLLSMVFVENSGKSSGKEVLTSIREGNYSYHELIKIKESGNTRFVYLVACGTNNCAAIDINTSDIYYFEKKFKFGEAVNSINI